ncbi:MAG: Ethanolamine utilization protein EutL [Firmicutes bacterium ADurb.Bin182]|nr:MAG: Ethanolamine utilization protein EutL [Firmicutes bacterium ADurb.Bin182]
MRGERIPVTILTARIIPNADPALFQALGLSQNERSLGILSTDCDDVSYAALDESTKTVRVRVVYARSMYAGSANSTTKLAGEFMGIIAGEEPAEIKSGLETAIEYTKKYGFRSANDDGSIVYFAHCISRSGSYLSKIAGIPEGRPIAYLIAPPTEAMVGLDAALKAADVKLCTFYGPPTETNFAGGLLTGQQEACMAACRAFAEAVTDVADYPLGV